MLRVTFASLRAHLRRLLSTGTAIVLGVGFLAATLFIGDSMRSSFDDLYEQANDGLAVEVRSSLSFGSDDVAVQSGTVDLALVPAVEGIDGIRWVAPTYEGRGQILDSEGDPMGGGGPPTLAGNWIDDPDLNPYRIADGRAPAATGEVVIDRRSADDGGLAVGDRTTVLTPAPVEVEVVGIATFGDSDSLGPVSWVAFSDAQAAELFVAADGQASSLRIAADEGTDAGVLAAAIDEVVPGDLDVRTGEQVAADDLAALEGDFIGFFETMLLAFAAIALLVATFSIHNTFAILVAQRVRESALLRAIGATRRQVTTAVAVEALAIGATASAVGVVAGIGLARLAFAAMEAAGFGTGAGVAVEPSAVIWSIAVGVVVAVVAAVAPAIGASRVPPIAALRDVAIERTSVSRVRVAGGVALLVVSVLALVAAPSFDDAAVRAAGLGALGLLVASVVLGPVVAGPVASVLGAPVEALRGLTGRLSRRNAVRNPRRTSGTASALTIGVAVVVVFTVLAASISSMLDDVVDRDFGGDLVVSTADFSGAGLSSGLAAAIDERPEVARAVGIGNGVLQVDGETWFAAVVDAPRLEGLLALDVVDGDLSAVGDGTIALATDVAEPEGLTVGDTVDATLAGGTEALEVAAVYETSPLLGDVLLPPAVWSRHTAQSSDVAVLIEGAEGVAPSDLDAAVTEVTEAHSAPAPQTREEYVEAAAGQIDQVLGIVYGLLAIAVLIAVMGIANTISLSVHERTREIGLLRAVGLSRSQLRSMVRWESVVVASYGTVIGLAMGLAAVWGLLRAMSELEDVVTPMQVPLASLAVVALVGVVAGVLAAWRPARRAARMDVLAAVVTD